jgi:UDP-N-acetylmuramyl pentapeptide synthase
MMTFRERIAWFRAQQYLARYRPYTIAVTGSYGREIAARAIAYALKSHRHVRNTDSIEHSIDIPGGILGAQSHKEHGGIMQLLTASKMRELRQLEPDTVITQVPLLTPKFAPWALHCLLPRMLVLTHIGREHIDQFGSYDMVLHEYAVLANSLQKDAVVILNCDDPALREIQDMIARPVITYGVNSSADLYMKRAVRQQEGLGMEVVLHGVHQELFLPYMFARSHVYAVGAGLAAAHGINIQLSEAVESMRLIKTIKGHMSRLHGVRGSTIIDDSIHTVPEQLLASLTSVAKLPHAGRKIVVLGDMEGLGQFTTAQHQEVGTHAAVSAQIAVFVGDAMRQAQDTALKAGTGVDTHHFATSSEAAAWLSDNIREGDIVFVSGGKSMKMQRIVKKLRKK